MATLRWLSGVASAAPVYWPPEGGRLTPQVQLFQLLVFVFLILDIFSDDCFVSTYGRDEISACPEALIHNPPLPLAIDTGKMDRAFTFDITDHLTDRVFGRNRQQHVNMSGIKWPSSTRLSRCSASCRNTGPRCRFSSPYSTFRRYFWNEND